MTEQKKVFSLEWAGRQLIVETGQYAKQANGAVLVRYGDSTILSTATASKNSRGLDFFPLTVNYEERLYAAGKIPGGFIKREGRPSEKAVLTSRLIDRPIRPLFADGFRNDVQVISLVLSVDNDSSPEMAAMLGSSLALIRVGHSFRRTDCWSSNWTYRRRIYRESDIRSIRKKRFRLNCCGNKRRDQHG